MYVDHLYQCAITTAKRIFVQCSVNDICLHSDWVVGKKPPSWCCSLFFLYCNTHDVTRICVNFCAAAYAVVESVRVSISRDRRSACPLLSVVFVFPQGKEAAAASADLEIFWAHYTLVDTSQWNLKHIVFYFNVVLLYFTWGYSKVKSKCYLFILAYLFTSTF